MINTKIKQAHTSSNMFDWRADGAIYNSVYTESSGWITHYYMYMTPLIAVKGGETYTWRISADTSSTSSRLTDITTVYYDKDLNEIGCASHDDSVRYYSFTVPQNCAYVRCPTSEVEAVDRESMLNVGSSPLPYEEYYAPYYDTVSYAKSITGAQTYTKFPIVLRTTEQSIPSWNVKGNMVQNGTPSPSNPVDVNGVGVRTKNLFKNDAVSTEFRGVQYTVNADKSVTAYGTAGSQVSYFILMGDGAATNNLSAFTTPIFKAGDTLKFSTDSSYKLQGRNTNGSYVDVLNGVVTLTKDIGLIYISVSNNTPVNTTIYPMITLSTETDTDYEPYGYKIPISSGGVTTNIYLGSTQTVRQIKKIVFDGTEQGWGKNTGLTNSNAYAISLPNWVGNRKIGYCTHYENVTSAEATEGAYFGNSLNILTALADGLDDATKFKNWLAEQYANGTPLTIWYILATPETATVNEPLMKIGTYADTLSNAASIPTTSGLNTIDVATTLKPSEMSLTYDGYKLCKGQRYSRTENLFDVDSVIIGKAWNLDSNTARAVNFIPITPNTTYTVKANSLNVDQLFICEKVNYSDTTAIVNTGKNITSTSPITFTTTITSGYLAVQFNKAEISLSDCKDCNLMLNAGSIAKPYQPYLVWE